MYKIAICDDNKAYLEVIAEKIQKYCKEHGFNIVLDSYSDSDKLAQEIEDKDGYDAYVLDIEMPHISGVELAERIRKCSEQAYIIFLTAHDSYAVRACGVNVISYVLKERLEAELERTLRELFERLDKLHDTKVYTIQNQRKYVKIRQRDIIYISKQQKNVELVLGNQEKESERISLQEIYKRLDNPDMYFLDRSSIINLQHVRKIVEYKVIMDNGHELITSKIHANELKEHLMSYWEERV